MIPYRFIASPITESSLPLEQRLKNHLKSTTAYFRKNRQGNDCQYHIQALLQLFLGNPIEGTPAKPAGHSYEILVNPSLFKLEGYSDILVSGSLKEYDTAGTTHEFAPFSYINLTTSQEPPSERSIISEKTTLTLYTIPHNKTETITNFLHEKYDLGNAYNQFAFIEIGLWNQQGHAVCYIYEKRGDQIEAYFCDPSIGTIERDAGVFFKKYSQYPYFAKKSLFLSKETLPKIKRDPEALHPSPSAKRMRRDDDAESYSVPQQNGARSLQTPLAYETQQLRLPTTTPSLTLNTNPEDLSQHIEPNENSPLDGSCQSRDFTTNITHYAQICREWIDKHEILIPNNQIKRLYCNKFRGLDVMFYFINQSVYGLTGQLELIAPNKDIFLMEIPPRIKGNGKVYFLNGKTHEKNTSIISNWICYGLKTTPKGHHEFLSERYGLPRSTSSSLRSLAINPTTYTRPQVQAPMPAPALTPGSSAATISETLDPTIVDKINKMATMVKSFYEGSFQIGRVYTNEVEKAHLENGVIYYLFFNTTQEVYFEIISGHFTCHMQFSLTDSTRIKGSCHLPSQERHDFWLNDWKFGGSSQQPLQLPDPAHFLSHLFEKRTKLIQKINTGISTCQQWHSAMTQSLRQSGNPLRERYSTEQVYREIFQDLNLTFRFTKISTAGVTGDVSVQFPDGERICLFFTPQVGFNNCTHDYIKNTEKKFRFTISSGKVANNLLTEVSPR